jgi:hypothetical protein
MLAYYETTHSGCVPVKVIGTWTDCMGEKLLECKVTANRYGYRRGELVHVEFNSSHIFPRHCLRKFRSSPFPKILPHDWRVSFADFLK